MSIRYPSVTASSTAGRLEQVIRYLRQLADELNLAADRTGRVLEQVKPVRLPTPESQFEATKALIIKSGELVEHYSQKLSKTLEGKFVTASDFGTYTQDTQARLEAADTALSTAVARVEKLTGEATGLRQQLTQLRQTAEALTMEVSRTGERVCTTTGFTFDEAGLTIARSDTGMENRLDEQGMQVLRAGQVLLSADAQGVRAADVAVDNYLQVGRSSRFEDYGTGRTACFFLG